MVATTGYQAGTDSNDSQFSYAVEAVYGTLPAVQFQAIRMISEGLRYLKTRARPQEITTFAEMPNAATMQETASGPVNIALSYKTYDDLFSSLLGSDWQGAQAINGVSADITFTNLTSTTGTLSSTTVNKFSAITQGQWIRLLGFSNTANNGYWFVTTVTDTTHLVLTGFIAPVTETPAGTAAKVRANTIRNGSQFKSLYIQQKFAANLFLRRPGAFITEVQLSGGVGKFLTGNFNVIAQTEASATTDASTGAVLAAPTGAVSNPGNFKGCFQNEVSTGAIIDQFSLTLTRVGAAPEYALGAAFGQGVTKGLIQATGTLRLYFRDFTLYAQFRAETQQRLEFIVEDGAGNGYVITLLSAALLNAQINAGGVNQPVMVSFEIEGNAQAGGGTVQFDALPNS